MKKVVFDTYAATLEKKQKLRPDIWELVFSLDKEIAFQAGQYVSVFFPKMKPAPFSIASSPHETGKIILGVEVVGPVTRKLSEMNPGESVQMKGPFGFFTLTDRKTCLIAGGIGVTPFLSMLRGEKRDVVLLFSARYAADLLWKEELDAMPTKSVYTCTREEAPGLCSGRISKEMIAEHVPDYLEREFLICGPREMITDLFATLGSMGVPDEQLRREVWH